MSWSPGSWVATLIDEQNKTPATRCPISGEGAASTYRQVVACEDACEICFAVATCDDCLVGVFGCEFDQALGWLWGPFALAGGWQPIE